MSSCTSKRLFIEASQGKDANRNREVETEAYTVEECSFTYGNLISSRTCFISNSGPPVHD